MFVAEETLKSAGTGGQAGLWMLALFLLGLSAMAYLTVREASLYETRSASRNLRRSAKAGYPEPGAAIRLVAHLAAPARPDPRPRIPRSRGARHLPGHHPP